jgi:hypothetical protein
MGETVDDVRKRKLAEALKHQIPVGTPFKDSQGRLCYKDSKGNIYNESFQLIKSVEIRAVTPPVTPPVTPHREDTRRVELKQSESRAKAERKQSRGKGYTAYLSSDFLLECSRLQVKPRDLMSYVVVDLRNKRI